MKLRLPECNVVLECNVVFLHSEPCQTPSCPITVFPKFTNKLPILFPWHYLLEKNYSSLVLSYIIILYCFQRPCGCLNHLNRSYPNLKDLKRKKKPFCSLHACDVSMCFTVDGVFFPTTHTPRSGHCHCSNNTVCYYPSLTPAVNSCQAPTDAIPCCTCF